MDLLSYLKSNSDFDNHIIIDQITTWPESIYNLIDSSKSDLKNYINEKKRIEEISNWANRPKNAYEDKWNSVVDLIGSYLQGKKLIGFHCSRLMDDEIENILANGLVPLNSNFAKQRINTVYERGLITSDLKERLLVKEEPSEEYREGTIHFFHNTSTFRKEMLLHLLFKSWGGEAIYSGFEQDKSLQKIGIPCIIVASIEYQELIKFDVCKQMLRIFLGDIYDFHEDFDSSVNKKINVLAIIKRGSELFNFLTNYEEWEEKIN